MGKIILLISIAVEVLFAAYCIITKSRQTKVRSIVRIGAFAAFIAMIVFSVLQWGFRYMLFAAALTVFAIIGTIRLLQDSKKKEEKNYSGKWIVVKAVLLSLLLSVAILPAIIFPQYDPLPVTGEYEVATSTYTYVDESRKETYSNTNEDRSVNVQFWYPDKAGGVYPLVVFSHGSYGIKTSNYSTFNELASHGYVVCSIDHPYHSLYTQSVDGKVTIVDSHFRQLVTDINNGLYDDAASVQLWHDITELRVEDMDFVIDTIVGESANQDTKKGTIDSVYKLVDSEKIGVFGHSLGGAASIQLGRERSDIGAVINLDGDMLCEYLGFENGKLLINEEIYTTPLLNIWTDSMVDLMAVEEEDIVFPHEYIAETALDEYDIHLSGTNHFSLTDLSLVSPFLVKMMMGTVTSSINMEADSTEVLEEMNGIILKFFDSYLKDNGTFSLTVE